MSEQTEKNLYIVVSQTGTIVSKIIQAVTRAKFCHVSVSLEENLATMYSFGRRYAYTPLFGGFIKETPQTGVFKRYPKTETVIFAFPLTGENYTKLHARLEEMDKNKKGWRYNYLGAILASVRKRYVKQGRYYCSEFIRELLLSHQLTDKILPEVMLPKDFLSLFTENEVYRGRLRFYCNA